jgi:flagellin-like hook-associated protein FlgL
VPSPCRYAPDTDVPTQLRVFKGLNPITKQPIYEVKTVKVHEDMSQAMSLLFDHVSELRGQSDGQFKRILNRLQIVRILNIMGTIATLHNAAMLSRNLADTLGDATSTVITAIGRATGTLTEEDNIDVNELVGGAFNDLMKGALGEEVWNGTKSTWLKANRVLSSASSIVTTIRSIGDSQRAVAEWTAENTGKIGNALKKWGVVGEKAYGWMPEKVTAKTAFQKKIDDFRGGVENLDEAASSLSSVASEVVNIQDEAKQIKEQWTEFDKNVKEAKSAIRPDNDAVKAVATAAKTASTGKLTGPADTSPTE